MPKEAKFFKDIKEFNFKYEDIVKMTVKYNTPIKMKKIPLN